MFFTLPNPAFEPWHPPSPPPQDDAVVVIIGFTLLAFLFVGVVRTLEWYFRKRIR